MKLLKDTEGFDIIVNGTDRTFRDTEQSALEAARMLSGRKGNDPVQVRYRATGKIVTVQVDGRVIPSSALPTTSQVARATP